jgi:hypothetical protein
MYRFMQRTAICAAIAIAILTSIEIGLLFFGSIPATATAGRPGLVNAILNIAGAGLLCGLMFSLFLTFQNLWDRAWEGEGSFAIPSSIRFTLGRLNGIARLAIGLSGIIAALIAITKEIYEGLTVGIWHTVIFCQSIQTAHEHFCPSKVPVISWIFNAPAFLVYSVVGLLLVRQGLSILSDRPDAEG